MLTLINDIKHVADAIEGLAFKMPAPNEFTPQFVALAIVAKNLAHEAERRRRKQFGLDSVQS